MMPALGPKTHRKRARRAYGNLVQAARKGNRLTYAEIANAIGLHHRAAQWFLGVIQREMRKRGLPPLQALVYNKRTGAPGCGYVATEPTGDAYERALKRVFGYRWPEKAPF